MVRGATRGTTAEGGRRACGNCVLGPVCPLGLGKLPPPLPFAILASVSSTGHSAANNATCFRTAAQGRRAQNGRARTPLARAAPSPRGGAQSSWDGPAMTSGYVPRSGESRELSAFWPRLPTRGLGHRRFPSSRSPSDAELALRRYRRARGIRRRCGASPGHPLARRPGYALFGCAACFVMHPAVRCRAVDPDLAVAESAARAHGDPARNQE